MPDPVVPEEQNVKIPERGKLPINKDKAGVKMLPWVLCGVLFVLLVIMTMLFFNERQQNSTAKRDNTAVISVYDDLEEQEKICGNH